MSRGSFAVPARLAQGSCHPLCLRCWLHRVAPSRQLFARRWRPGFTMTSARCAYTPTPRRPRRHAQLMLVRTPPEMMSCSQMISSRPDRRAASDCWPTSSRMSSSRARARFVPGLAALGMLPKGRLTVWQIPPRTADGSSATGPTGAVRTRRSPRLQAKESPACIQPSAWPTASCNGGRVMAWFLPGTVPGRGTSCYEVRSRPPRRW